MARKTKREKIMAEYHRRIETLNNSELTVHSSLYSLPKKQAEITVNTALPAGRQVHREPRTDYSYVPTDIARIMILTVLAICAQLVLWYILRK